MNGLPRAALIAAAVLGVGWVAFAGVRDALNPAMDVATFRAERGDFVHRVEAEGILVAENATPIVTPAGADGPMKIAWLAQDGMDVEEGQVVIRYDPTDMEQALYDGEAERDKALSQTEQRSIQQTTTLDNLERDELLADLQLEHFREFQTTDSEVYSRVEIIESQIDETLATRRKDHASEAREISDELGQVELDLLGLDKRQAQIAIDKAEAGLRALEVRAPHAGIFVLRRDRGEPPTIGTISWPGRPLAEIPQLDVMKAQVYVLEADAGGVEPGIAASVVLEAHPDLTFPAEVRRVAAVAKQRNRWSPVQYFDIDLALDETNPVLMKPGQRVRATLLVQNLEDVIAVPREAIFRDEETNPWVFRRAGGGFERIPVVLGAAALGRVVVESGISAGDVLALQDPTRAAPAAASASGGAPLGPPGR